VLNAAIFNSAFFAYGATHARLGIDGILLIRERDNQLLFSTKVLRGKLL
jgi:hypothetical protein